MLRRPSVDVRYYYDELPDWAEYVSELPTGTRYLAGRATGSSDRGQRSAVLYDRRGNATWGVRQMALVSDELTLQTVTPPSWDDRPRVSEDAPVPDYVAYDEAHSYVREAEFDHANRGVAIVLPLDPDFDPTGLVPAPEVRGELTYQRRGLPYSALVRIGETDQTIVESITYTRDGLPADVVLGDGSASRAATTSTTLYDERRRPIRMTTTRDRTTGSIAPELGYVTAVADQELVWDAASNLTDIVDHRIPGESPAGHQPQTVRSEHDALYRVIRADFEYGGSTSAGDLATDWRDEQARVRSEGADPMDGRPAPMLPTLPPERVRSLTWEWDWLANMTEWTDDQSSFHERSIGGIGNGNGLDPEAGLRPSALYLATNLPFLSPTMPVDGGSGWLETEYGAGGNLLTLTARAQCSARPGASSCTLGSSGDLMRDWHELMTCEWECASEQHYEYRWDELDRLAEARRWDRNASTSGWELVVRQRYRYDGANQRTVKQTLDPDTSAERIALYVYPGDFERRGVVRNVSGEYEAADGRSETQYVVAGARIVEQHSPTDPEADWARNRRVVLGVASVVRTTQAAVDLLSGELAETSTYYPNGSRESYRAATGSDLLAASEPNGFTGKESDAEVGLVYFGERYLVASVARWATPDPLHIDTAGGGESLNAYHYISGSLLQGRDPLGLQEIEGSTRIFRTQQPLRGRTIRIREDGVRGQVSVRTGETAHTRPPPEAGARVPSRLHTNSIVFEFAGRGADRVTFRQEARATAVLRSRTTDSDGNPVIVESGQRIRHIMTPQGPTYTQRPQDPPHWRTDPPGAASYEEGGAHERAPESIAIADEPLADERDAERGASDSLESVVELYGRHLASAPRDFSEIEVTFHGRTYVRVNGRDTHVYEWTRRVIVRRDESGRYVLGNEQGEGRGEYSVGRPQRVSRDHAEESQREGGQERGEERSSE